MRARSHQRTCWPTYPIFTVAVAGGSSPASSAAYAVQAAARNSAMNLICPPRFTMVCEDNVIFFIPQHRPE